MKAFADKIGMTHAYDERGRHGAVTVLKLKKTILCGKKKSEIDGYAADIYALIDEKRPARKSIVSKYKEAKNARRMVEQKLSDDASQIEVGKPIGIGDFAVGDKVAAYGVSKGKGFAGTVKRHGFTTGPKTHGSCNYRKPGSIGPTSPSRVIKGRRMAGHMGATNVKVKNLVVVYVDEVNNSIWVKGSIPGAPKSQVVVEK